jgi:hypothetical protein
MLKVVENYTLRRGLAVSASLGSRLCVHLCARLYVCLLAKTGCALVMPVLSRVTARGAMQEAP